MGGGTLAYVSDHPAPPGFHHVAEAVLEARRPRGRCPEGLGGATEEVLAGAEGMTLTVSDG